MSHIQRLKERLLSLHDGGFQDAVYLNPWLSPAVVSLLLDHGRQVHPRAVRFVGGEWMQCHKNALELATRCPDLVPWFGLGVYREVGATEFLWWIHSWVVDREGVLHDSSVPPDAPPMYWGIPWGRELYQVIPKRADAVEVTELPLVLTRSIFL